MVLNPSHCGRALALFAALTLCGAASVASAKTVDPVVAVLYFDYNGQTKEMEVLKKGLAQMLISDLQGTDGVKIVERDRLEEILKEIDLGKSKKVDSSTAAKIGKLLGARYFVWGSYFDLFGTLQIDARVTNVETGVHVGVAKANGKPEDFMSMKDKLAADLEVALRTQLPAIVVDETKVKKKKAKRKRRRQPKKMKASLALRYAKALDAKDRGDIKAAKTALKEVCAAAPEFELAAVDLANLVQ